MSQESKSPYLIEGNWYGHWLPLPHEVGSLSKEDPVFQQMVEFLKNQVIESIGNRPMIILNEQIVIKDPFIIDEHLTFPGSIGWKAQIITESISNETVGA